MQLCEALDISSPAIVAVVGAGGKTTLLQRLATELAAQGCCVISTTTTAIWRPDGYLLVEADTERLLTTVAIQAGPGRVLTVAAAQRMVIPAPGEPERPKLLGIPPTMPIRLLAVAGISHVLVEADGARGRAIKAPAAHEPVIPPEATHVVAVVGIDALGQPLSKDIAHRPEHIAALLGLALGAPIGPYHIATLLAHPQGGRKAVPAAADFYVFINKVQDEASLAGARAVAAHLRGAVGANRVVVGAAQASRPVLEVW